MGFYLIKIGLFIRIILLKLIIMGCIIVYNNNNNNFFKGDSYNIELNIIPFKIQIILKITA